MTRVQATFLALVAVQAAHSVEAYVGRLYEVFAPARFVSGLISQDLQRGFLVFNAILVAFGFWCFFWPIRRDWPSAIALMRLWIAIELVNGIGHPRFFNCGLSLLKTNERVSTVGDKIPFNDDGTRSVAS